MSEMGARRQGEKRMSEKSERERREQEKRERARARAREERESKIKRKEGRNKLPYWGDLDRSKITKEKYIHHCIYSENYHFSR